MCKTNSNMRTYEAGIDPKWGTRMHLRFKTNPNLEVKKTAVRGLDEFP